MVKRPNFPIFIISIFKSTTTISQWTDRKAELKFGSPIVSIKTQTTINRNKKK